MTAHYAYRLGWRSLRRVVPSHRERSEAARPRPRPGDARLRHHDAPARRDVRRPGRARERRLPLPRRDRQRRRLRRPPRPRQHAPRRRPRFKGRTYIQITGRTNYAAISHALGVDFLAHPAKLAEPAYAAKGAAWWWKTHGCNQIADTGDFTALTRRINGGTNGLASRQAYYRRARLVALPRPQTPQTLGAHSP
jgi:hypothetical protein